jgi:hypothetical protein
MEEVKYYLDNGMVVFTEKFLLDRGFCCDNNCRHCPYKKLNKNENTTRDVQNSESGEAKHELRQGCPHSRIEDEDA